MKKFKFLTALLVAVCLSAGMVAGLCACGGDGDSDETLYKVTYTAGEGTGTAPAEKSYAEGTAITLEQNPFTYEGHTFAGWSADGQTYNAGASFTVPAHDTTFTATWTDAAETLYKVTYAAGEGTGTAPAEKSYAEGTVITLEQNPFTYVGHLFAGWSANGQIYQGGDEYTIPAHDTEFTATWTAEPHPAFLQTGYEYDRLGGGALELTFDLDGANFLYLELDEERVPTEAVSYDGTKQAIVVSASYILSLEKGTYEITAITDADPATCSLTIVQSLETTFDETTAKAFFYGKDEGISFEIGYNTTTPVRLMMGDTEIDDAYWTYDAASFTVKGEWLSHFSEAKEYRVYLSNNDSYAFTVTSNVLFATDYDVFTIHDTTESDIGHNPLYQYYSNVEIADSPAAMGSGKALKITPNTEDVTYDCHGYLTLRVPAWGTMWREVHFVSGKTYAVSFDYLTEQTEDGGDIQFSYKSASTSWKKDLLLGPANDGKLHHFAATVSYEEIGNGIFLWAFFKGAAEGGTVWVDNFKVTELDKAPSISVSDAYSGTGDYNALTLNAAGLRYSILIDGEAAEGCTLQGDELTVPAAALAELAAGAHTIAVQTVFGVLASAEFRIVSDSRVSAFTETEKNYLAADGEDLVFEGSFSETLEVTSLHLVEKVYDNGYGGWSFLFYNTEKNYKDYVTLNAGEEGNGEFVLDAELLAKFWGETEFVAEFNNGKAVNFTVNIQDVLYASDYDNITMRGYLNGGLVDGLVINSGMRGSGVSIEVAERSDEGGKAFFVRGSEGAEDPRLFTFRYSRTNPTWDWYHISSEFGTLIRISFEYQITSAFDGAYFDVGGTNETNVFGDYTTAVTDSIQFKLQADGAVHTFDSGWFVHTDGIRTSVFLPRIAAADGQYAMFDNIRAVKKMATATVGAALTYNQGEPSAVTIALNGKTAKSATVDGETIGYDAAEDAVTLKQEKLNTLGAGKHTVLVETNEGYIICTLNILSGDAKLTETSKTVKYGESGTVKLNGKFKAGLRVTKIYRSGEYTGYDTNPDMDPSYITVEADGLVIARALLDQVYKTCTYTVTFDNEETVTFTLTSDLVWFTNYDETLLYEHGVGNVPLCQDTDMVKLAKDAAGDGSHFEYRPGDAKLGHSSNPAGGDNFGLTFNTVFNGGRNWFQLNTAATGKLKVFFDFKVTGNDKPGRFIFVLLDGKTEIQLTESYDEHGNATGKFSYEFNLEGVSGIGIRYKAGSLEECQGCVLEMDNFGIAYSAE